MRRRAESVQCSGALHQKNFRVGLVVRGWLWLIDSYDTLRHCLACAAGIKNPWLAADCRSSIGPSGSTFIAQHHPYAVDVHQRRRGAIERF